MRRRAETQIQDSLHRVSRQAVQAQVVAALVIRDAVGDAINRPQAAVKPGPWPGRRAAGEALSRGLLSVLGGHVHGRTFTCPHLGSVYLYLRRSETGLPLPEAPQASPTSTCAPALPGTRITQSICSRFHRRRGCRCRSRRLQGNWQFDRGPKHRSHHSPTRTRRGRHWSPCRGRGSPGSK